MLARTAAALICLGLATDVFAGLHPVNLDLSKTRPESYYCSRPEEIRVDLYLMAMSRQEREEYNKLDTMGKIDFWATVTDQHGCLFLLPISALE